MLILFLFIFLAFFLVGIGCVWVGNKVYLSMKKDNKKFEKENKEE